MREYYFFISSLPSLPPLGERPLCDLFELRERAADFPDVLAAIDVICLEQDLRARQSVLSGQNYSANPFVLTKAQIMGEEPLFEYVSDGLDREGGADFGRESAKESDAIWERYFYYAEASGRALRCGFLQRWSRFEVSLRNELVVERARRLGLPADEYLAAHYLRESLSRISEIVSSWAAVSDPLQALRALDLGRWDWLMRNRAWFSFHIDEAAAYAQSLALLDRWCRIEDAGASYGVAHGS